MSKEFLLNKKGITLIELLVAMIISAAVIAGIYRVFVAQTRAYTVQEQVRWKSSRGLEAPWRFY